MPLESTCGDGEGILALRDGRLFAVLARLGSLHEKYEGCWFVETAFTPAIAAGDLFSTLPDFLNHASARVFDRVN
jgi:hypothetical protein